MMSAIKELEAKLLALGGTRVITSPEPSPSALLARGRVFPAAGIKRVKGRRCQAHQNAALLYLNRLHFGRPEGLNLVTGFALKGDLWCPHSWLWDGRQVLETDGRPVMYYGVVLDAGEVKEFVLKAVANVLRWAGPAGSSSPLTECVPGATPPKAAV